MKHILMLLLLILGFQTKGVAQKWEKIPPPLLPPPAIRIAKMPATPKQTLYEKLLNTSGDTEQAFAYTVDADTVILPKEVFKKQLEIGSNGVRLETASAKDTLRISKGKGLSLLSNYVKYSFYDMKIAKDVATLTDKETKQVQKYRIFLNSKKTGITKMQDLATKEFYLPAEVIGALPTIGF